MAHLRVVASHGLRDAETARHPFERYVRKAIVGTKNGEVAVVTKFISSVSRRDLAA